MCSHSKIFPEKDQGQIFRKGIMDKKNASSVERISLCRSRFHANSYSFPCHPPHFHSLPMRQNEEFKKRLEWAFPCKGGPGKIRIYQAMFQPQKRAMGKDAPALLKKRPSLLPLSSKFWITLIPEKASSAREKAFSPFGGAATGKERLWPSSLSTSRQPSIRGPSVLPGRRAHTEWAVASVRK